MSHAPDNTCTINTYCQSGSNGIVWYDLITQFTLDPRAVNSSNSPYVSVVNNIPESVTVNSQRFSLNTGLYVITHEYHAKWNVTDSGTITVLKRSPLYRWTGNRGWSEYHPPSLSVVNTGKVVSSGYNVLKFKATHYVEIENNGTTNNSFFYGYGRTRNYDGFDHGSVPIYKRSLTFEKVVDLEF